jgi:hypothetical protein
MRAKVYWWMFWDSHNTLHGHNGVWWLFSRGTPTFRPMTHDGPVEVDEDE